MGLESSKRATCRVSRAHVLMCYVPRARLGIEFEALRSDNVAPCIQLKGMGRLALVPLQRFV
jgi:hypothetical protein